MMNVTVIHLSQNQCLFSKQCIHLMTNVIMPHFIIIYQFQDQCNKDISIYNIHIYLFLYRGWEPHPVSSKGNFPAISAEVLCGEWQKRTLLQKRDIGFNSGAENISF